VSPDLPRSHCAVCGEGGLEPFLEIPACPVFQGCVPFARGAAECASMTWVGCPACGCAQIAPLPALERIYQAGHATGLGAAWARHHAGFADFLRAQTCGAIVDVGGGSGTLAGAYRRGGGELPWTILEPNALRVPNLPDDIAVVDGFLEEDALTRIGAATVVMCHMFEHVVDLRATLEILDGVLPADGRICLAWPELESWTRKGVAGALNFEHGVYVTVPRLLALFAQFGWRIEARQLWPENDTWFLAFARGAADTSAPRGDGVTAVSHYFGALRTQAETLARTLGRHDGEAFLMPASIYAQALLTLGLPEKRFAALLDNSPAKQGRRLYGTDLHVMAPSEILLQARDPLVIINGGAHDAEMAAGLRALRPDTRITSLASREDTPARVMASCRH
jgi:hypothetical protein